jgi:N6-adenosine-specific RNA methylase IME4/ParB-like chromosome segregation protein Spo0J
MKRYEHHEIVKLIPEMSAEEFEALKKNIAEHGLHEDILVHDAKLNDGRHRERACIELGIEPRYREWSGDCSVIALVLSLNVHRRHLSQSQRAVIAVEVLPMFESEARERRLAGLKQGKELPSAHSHADGGKAAEHAASIIQVSPRYVEDAKAIKNQSPEKFEAIKTGAMSITEAKRELKEEKREDRRQQNKELVAQSPNPLAIGAKFATIVIDPPWDWGDEGDVDQLGRSRPTYSTMPIDEIMALPVGNLADVDCHLYMWITNRSLPKGFALLDAWGFRYVTCLTWCKPSFGMGNYFRGQTEHVLFGVKGSQMLKRRDVGTCFHAPRGPGGHSSKPVEFYSLVESCSPGPYLEMFARSGRPDWTAWGAEA